MAYRVYLDSNFEPTTREAATLIKAVSDDGKVKFYHPKQTARTMKAYNPDEPRDKQGKWTSGSSGDSGDPEIVNIIHNGRTIKWDRGNETLTQAIERQTKPRNKPTEEKPKDDKPKEEPPKQEKPKEAAPVAPPSKPTPNGVKTSSIIDVADTLSKKIKDVATETQAAIDKVHGVSSDTPNVRMTPFGSVQRVTRRFQGVYYPTLGQMQVRDKAESPHMTAAHEFGHHLDYFGGLSQEDRRNIIDTARQSPEIQQLQSLKRNSRVEVSIPYKDGTVTKAFVQVPRKWLTYATSDKEIFARAYAQHIATRSENPAMTQELNDTVSKNKQGHLPMPTQWEHESFKPIAEAFDRAFKNKGWVK